MDDDLLIRRLAALGQRQRLRIYAAVAGAGAAGTSPSALAEGLTISHSLVSAHLAKLVSCGLLHRDEEGGRVTLSASADAGGQLLRRMERLLAG